MPWWRNGRRNRLKIDRGQPRESSTLSRGTHTKDLYRLAKLALWGFFRIVKAQHDPAYV
ncbi:MAG: hypothetical protein RL094_586 [Candidatus Parcubacteria bacterium]